MDFRSSLNNVRDQKINFKNLADRHPFCECERANPEFGGQGPVAAYENVCWFLTSRDFKKIKTAEQLTEDLIRKSIKVGTMAKAFRGGMSIYRVSPGHVTSTEFLISIKKVYESLVADDPEYGGVFGSLTIQASFIRNAINGGNPFCIYDTPSDKIRRGRFLRPSHADIVWSKNIDKASLGNSRNSRETLQKTLQYYGKIDVWREKTSEYLRFLPQKIKEELSIF